MTQPYPAARSASRPTAWVFAAPGAGDSRQLETLVELLGADARWIEPVDPLWTVLADRLLDPGGRRLPAGKRSRLAPPWPDLVLIAGGRSVIDARRIRRASGGHSRVVCVGRPWAPLDWFDLVLTTPQYRLPQVPNVMMLDLPLNRPPKQTPATELSVPTWFEALPRPVLGVLLGGDSGSFRFTLGDAHRLVERINDIVGDANGSAVVVASPRTPPAAVTEIGRGLSVPARVIAYSSDEPSYYAAVLRWCDAFAVTADSASMLAEACRTGRPVAVADLHERIRSRWSRRLRSVFPVLEGWTAAAAARGLWVPARDMRRLHLRARESGWITALDRVLSEEGRSTPDTDAALEAAVRGVRSLLTVERS
jgi:hypothetical protein